MRLSAIALAATATTLVAGCGSSPDEPVSAEAPSSTGSTDDQVTTTAPVVAAWPLTARGVSDPALVAHPAVSVKIDNHPNARPQTGMNEADVVYEIRVEGFTRFAAVFHSAEPDTVGPVRSARTSDIDIVANLNRPVFAWSGGNPTVTAQVQAAAEAGTVVNANFDVDERAYRRDSSLNGERAPHNLYVDVSRVQELADPEAAAPGAIFEYRSPDEPLPQGAVPVAGVSIDFSVPGLAVDYAWDPGTGTWARFQTDQNHRQSRSEHLDSAGVQVAPRNLVVLKIPYGTSDADWHSPEAHSTGSGDGVVFVDGAMIPVRWTREQPTHRWTLTTPDGAPVKLNPGPTWVALPEPGDTAKPMAPESAEALLATRSAR